MPNPEIVADIARVQSGAVTVQQIPFRSRLAIRWAHNLFGGVTQGPIDGHPNKTNILAQALAIENSR